MLEENKDWLFVSPNLGFTAIAAHEGSDWFTEEQVEAMGFREELEVSVEAIRELMKRGVRILGGGDYGFMITPHGQNARDLDHFVKHCGLTNMESILTMTKWNSGIQTLLNLWPHWLSRLLRIRMLADWYSCESTQGQLKPELRSTM